MSLEDFEFVLSRLPKYQAVLHLHGYGEPLLDKSLAEKIRYTKKNTPYLTQIITTLGTNITEEALKELVQSGLDSMIISFYGSDAESYKAVHNVNKFEAAFSNLEKLAKLCDTYNPKLIRLVKTLVPQAPSLVQVGKSNSYDSTPSFISKLESMGYKVGITPPWHNYSNGREFNPTNSKVCPVIIGKRNRILQITWDLDVIPCCFDFDATIKFGNLRESSLEDIFKSQAYTNFVMNHLRGDLSLYPACQGCEKIDA